MWTEPADLLLVATSARAIAESAVRGGFRVRALDGFGDEDTRALGPCTRLPLVDLGAGIGLEPARVTAALRRFAANGPARGLVYGAGLESSPAVLSDLPDGVRLLGNDPAVLTLLKDPRRFFALLATLDIPHPATRLEPPPAMTTAPWLVKACGGSGGGGVAPWCVGDPRPAVPHYFQRLQEGDLMSVLFLADGRHLTVIGFNHLLLADAADPRRPFRYGGAIGQAAPAEPVRQAVTQWGRSLVGALGLRGLNNLDFIVQGGQPALLELNPRPSATLNLYEGQCPGGWIRQHVRACLAGLPAAQVRPATEVCGQRVLYAPVDLTIPPALAWPHWCRDRSAAGTRIPRGAPLCTVLAKGADAAAVAALLAARAAAILRQVQRGTLAEGPSSRSAPSLRHRAAA